MSLKMIIHLHTGKFQRKCGVSTREFADFNITHCQAYVFCKIAFKLSTTSKGIKDK
jgi:hypothetical protein